MKLAVLTPRHFDPAAPGGAARWPLNLASGLAGAGAGRLQVDLVASDAEAWRRWEGPDLATVALAAAAPAVPTWELTRVIADADAVVVDDALSPFGEAALLAAAHARRPCLAALRGGDPDPRDGHGAAVQLAGAVLLHSEAERERWIAGGRVEVIRGGVDGDSFTPPAAGAVRDIAVFAGRIAPEKGLDGLLAALPAGVRLVICGPAPRPAERERIAALAAGSGAELLGVVDDTRLRDLYRRAYAVVLPSTRLDHAGLAHPFPEWTALALLEGMACGAPAVCTRVGPLPELVEDGVTGVVCDGPAAVAAELERLRCDPDRVAALGGAARAAVEQRYDRRVVGARVALLLSTLAAG